MTKIESMQKVVEMAAQGVRPESIAHHLDVTYQFVTRTIGRYKKLGDAIFEERKRGRYGDPRSSIIALIGEDAFNAVVEAIKAGDPKSQGIVLKVNGKHKAVNGWTAPHVQLFLIKNKEMFALQTVCKQVINILAE
ncbi:MAG: hypothetical protein ACK4XK_14180 [Casimicrobiaceae bacterium]